MKTVVASVALLGALASAPTPLFAAPISIPYAGTTIMCVKPDGATTLRLEDRPSNYTRVSRWVGCSVGSTEVPVDICRDDEAPVRDSPETNRVRAAAVAQGTLRSVRYQGRRFCQREYLNGPMADIGVTLTQETWT